MIDWLNWLIIYANWVVGFIILSGPLVSCGKVRIVSHFQTARLTNPWPHGRLYRWTVSCQISSSKCEGKPFSCTQPIYMVVEPSNLTHCPNSLHLLQDFQNENSPKRKSLAFFNSNSPIYQESTRTTSEGLADFIWYQFSLEHLTPWRKRTVQKGGRLILQGTTVTYPTLGKGNASTQTYLGWRYVSSKEGIGLSLLDILFLLSVCYFWEFLRWQFVRPNGYVQFDAINKRSFGLTMLYSWSFRMKITSFRLQYHNIVSYLAFRDYESPVQNTWLWL